MSGKKFFQIDPGNRPNRTTRERVVSERGRKELSEAEMAQLAVYDRYP